MDAKKLFDKARKPFLDTLKALGIIAGLSLLIDVCTLFMTVVPFDLGLVRILVTDIRIVALNFLPIFALMTVTYFIFGNIGVGFTLTGAAAFCIAQVNIYTMTFRDTPFSFSDIKLVGEASEMLKTYSLFLGGVSIAVLCVLIITAVLCFWLLPKIKTNVFVRISGIIICAVLIILAGNRFYRDGFGGYGVYLSTWHPEFGNEYKTADQNMSRGVVYCFARSVYATGPQAPDGYDESLVKDVLSKYKDTPTDEDKKVHIISIMLEAYNDFSKFPGIELNLSPYENMHNLQKDGYSGLLYTNIFAGNTIYTERSFLTGFGGVEYDKKTMSHVRYLKSQGYYTEAIHPFYGWFYDRKNVYNYLGFDNFYCHENKFSGIPESELKSYLYNGMISDLDLFEHITKSFEETVDRGEKYFGFSVTYQNHGPYASESTTDRECLVRKDSYTEEAYHRLNNYLSEVYRTDLAIKNLRDYVDGHSEPIVLVLFGDHNPTLGDGVDGYTALGIDMDTSTPEGAENYYCTPYVFYANDAAKKALGTDMKGEGPTLSPVFLMNELFEQMGFGGSYYMNYLEELKDRYNVLGTGFVQTNGEYLPRSTVWSDAGVITRQWIEYYLKTKGISKDGFSITK